MLWQWIPINEYFNLWQCCFDNESAHCCISLQAVLLVGWRTVSGYTTVTHSRRKNDKVGWSVVFGIVRQTVFHGKFYMYGES